MRITIKLNKHMCYTSRSQWSEESRLKNLKENLQEKEQEIKQQLAAVNKTLKELRENEQTVPAA
jgi:uncharacterized protein YlxW (UPF0749 family)